MAYLLANRQFRGKDLLDGGPFRCGGFVRHFHGESGARNHGRILRGTGIGGESGDIVLGVRRTACLFVRERRFAAGNGRFPR
jgi:hypothetical protein